MAHTHDLMISPDVVVKQYSSWDRGEHLREWAVLSAVHESAPDLVPVPLRADFASAPPTIWISRVPGEPLRGRATAEQLDGLAVALRALWSVPVAALPLRRFSPTEAWRVIAGRFAAADRPDGIAGDAFDAALDFLAGPPLPDESASVLGHGDPNLANYLWDGEAVRIVDFEDAGRSDVAYELATLVEHLASRDNDWEGFIARFDADLVRLRSGRRLVAAQWLHMLLPGGPSAGRNPPGVLDLQARRLLELMVDERLR